MNLIKDFDQMWQGHTTVYGGDDHIMLVLLPIQHVPVQQTKDVRHGVRVSEIGFQCVRTEVLRSTSL
jgi:hypothetical protein